MNFPLLISDEQQFARLHHEITRHTVKETVRETLAQVGLIKSYLLKSECESLSSYQKIKNAIANRELKFTTKGRNQIIDRNTFYDWIFKDELL